MTKGDILEWVRFMRKHAHPGTSRAIKKVLPMLEREIGMDVEGTPLKHVDPCPHEWEFSYADRMHGKDVKVYKCTLKCGAREIEVINM